MSEVPVLTTRRLSALPPGSVVLDADRAAWQLNELHLWVSAEHPWPIRSRVLHEGYGPCSLIWSPKPIPGEES